MRHNAVMGVVAVACVAVMNGQALGPMGRLHLHKGDRAGARNQHVAGMGFFDEEAPSGAPDLTFSTAQLGLAGLLTLPKFVADAADDGPDAPAAANVGFGRPASGAGAIARPQAAPPPTAAQDKPPQDPPPPDPPPRAASSPAASWVDAALTPDKPVPPVTPDPPPVVVVTPVVVITPPVSPPPPDLPPPVLPLTRLAAAPPALPAPIPEPATWMMMVLGFGAVAAALRRRRRGAGQGWPTETGPAL